MRVIWLSQAMLCLTYDQKPIVLRVDNYVYKTTAKKMENEMTLEEKISMIKRLYFC